MTTRWTAALLAVAAALAFSRQPLAQQRFTAEELTMSPYRLDDSRLNTDQRVSRHERLAAVAEQAGDWPRAARHYAVACHARTSETRDAALPASPCARAREMAAAHHLKDVSIQLLVTTGNVQAWNFNFGGAVRTLNEAVALGEGLDVRVADHWPVIAAHHILGSTLVELGQFDAAGKSLTFARDQCRASGNATCAAYSDIWLCRMHTMLGDYGVARAACDAGEAEAAVDHDVLVAAHLGWMRGMLEAALGRHAASLASLQAAWQLTEAPETQALRPILAPLIIDAMIRLKRLDEAESWQRQLDQALADRRVPFYLGPQIAMRRGQLAAVQGRLDDAEAAFTIGSRSLIHEMSIRGYLAVARIAGMRGNPARARESLERAIARIETARTSVGGTALRTSYLTLHAKAYGELVGVRWDADGDTGAAAALQTAEAGRARALLDSLASAQVAGAAAPTLDGPAIQALLSPDEVLIEYVSLEDRLFAFTVTNKRISLAPLPNAGTADELTRRVEFFRALVQENDEAALGPSAKRLYADLLAPALDPVAGTARTLIIAADGPLHRLPFDAIGDAPRLIDRWNVVTVPSASALANRRRASTATSGALVVAASPDSPGLPPLRAAPDEAAAVHRRVAGVAELSGSTVTEEQMLARGLDRFAVLHFASHAVLDEERPLRSALVLTGGSGSDGRWSADEIYRTPLNADLVVLSACSTAAGAATPGEGVMSLARAFLHAGAGATLATLWDVPDAPGPMFADVLYRELSAGKPLGEAAATVRRELRQRGAPPQVWAAYVLTGNPDAKVGVSAPLGRRMLSASVVGGLAVILLLAAAMLFLARNRVRLTWRVPAAAGTGAAVLAIALVQTPDWRVANQPVAGAIRGDVLPAIKPIVDRGRLAWTPVAGADEYSVELFDAAGVPVGEPVTTATPQTTPAAASDGWIRIAARRQGQTVSRSAIVRFPGQ